jgi:tetratricopeptide (TPR) repeat protein
MLSLNQPLFIGTALRAKLKAMTTENQQTIPEQSPPEVPPDHELFAGEVHEELSEREVFVGNEDFYKLLADSAQAAATQPRQAGTGISLSALFPPRNKHFSTAQKVLAAGIVAIGAMLLYALLKSPSGPTTNIALTPATPKTSSPKPSTERSAQIGQQQIQKPEPVLSPTQPLSLEVAQNFYLEKDYDKAYVVYNQLRQKLSKTTEEEPMRDFLQLKMALCTKKTGDIEQAAPLFRMLSKSRSPVVSAVANYHMSLIETQKRHYLKARTKAYQTIALIDTIDFNRDWALSLQRDCHFLAAECLTRNILSLCDADKDLPEDLWSNSSPTDPFTNLNEIQLRSFLNSGSKQLRKGVLAPQIQKLKNQPASTDVGGTTRYSAVCYGASIEELLARFAANAGLDIHWAFDKTSAPDGTEGAVRKRPVNLYLPATTTQQFLRTATGCVGLLPRLDDNPDAPAVNIINPENYSSLSEHISLLSREAISLWQNFLLTFHNDERIPNTHFAMRLLQAQRGQPADAIAEYKLVANRFPQASLAPFALLHSSNVKASLGDYFGARQDLKQLVEQYPDSDFGGRACLYLADATMKANLYDEAARLYRKVYNLGLSSQLQTAAALKAGKCFHKMNDHQSAAEWLTRYLSVAKDRTNKDSFLAYHLLGKTNLALGKPKQACEAFQYALAGQLSREEYIETISALVRGHMQQEQFIEALDTLENIRSWPFSQKESIELVLLRSEIFRTMGLVDKAIVLIGDRAEYISDPQLKAKISFELTKCHIAKGNLQLARDELTEILVFVEAGPLAHEVAVELADVYLKLGHNAQTISICSQLLDWSPSAKIKQKTLNIMAMAYKRQKNYDKAAETLMALPNETETPNEGTFNSPSVTEHPQHQAQQKQDS